MQLVNFGRLTTGVRFIAPNGALKYKGMIFSKSMRSSDNHEAGVVLGEAIADRGSVVEKFLDSETVIVLGEDKRSLNEEAHMISLMEANVPLKLETISNSVNGLVARLNTLEASNSEMTLAVERMGQIISGWHRQMMRDSISNKPKKKRKVSSK